MSHPGPRRVGAIPYASSLHAPDPQRKTFELGRSLNRMNLESMKIDYGRHSEKTTYEPPAVSSPDTGSEGGKLTQSFHPVWFPF